MTRIIRLLDTKASALDNDCVEVIAGTSKMARDGHIVDMRGLDMSAFLRSGTILWSHDPKLPVGIPISGRVDAAGNLQMTIQFAPDGASVSSDECRKLVKAGIIRNMSIGFKVIEAQQIDPKRAQGGKRITRSELWEVSFVSIPADPGAVVKSRGKEDSEAARARRQREYEVLRLIGQGYLNERDATFDRRQRQLEVLKRGPGTRADFERRQDELRRLSRKW